MVVDLDMIDRIMIPLLFSSLIICQTRQQIIERYPSGDKKIVSVYKGSGLSEQLVWRYTFHVDGSLIRYENFQENLNYKISDDDLHFVDKINNQKAMGELINVLGKDWKAFRNNESYQYQLINNDLFNFLSKDKWVSNYSVETQRLQGFIRMSVPTPVTLTLEFKRLLFNGEIHKHMSTIKFFNEVLNDTVYGFKSDINYTGGGIEANIKLPDGNKRNKNFFYKVIPIEKDSIRLKIEDDYYLGFKRRRFK